MVDPVLSGDREAIFDVDVHEEVFDYGTTMRVVELFYHLALAADVEDLFSLSEGMPFILVEVFQGPVVIPDNLVEDILVIDVSGGRSPGKFVILSDRQSWHTVSFRPECRKYHLILLINQIDFSHVEQRGDQEPKMRIIGKQRPASFRVLASDNPGIGAQTVIISRRDMNGPDRQRPIDPMFLQNLLNNPIIILHIPPLLFDLIISHNRDLPEQIIIAERHQLPGKIEADSLE